MSFVLYFTNNGAICKTFYVKALRNLRNIINRVCRNNGAVKDIMYRAAAMSTGVMIPLCTT